MLGCRLRMVKTTRFSPTSPDVLLVIIILDGMAPPALPLFQRPFLLGCAPRWTMCTWALLDTGRSLETLALVDRKTHLYRNRVSQENPGTGLSFIRRYAKLAPRAQLFSDNCHPTVRVSQ